jgi:hypothetical protein
LHKVKGEGIEIEGIHMGEESGFELVERTYVLSLFLEPEPLPQPEPGVGKAIGLGLGQRLGHGLRYLQGIRHP